MKKTAINYIIHNRPYFDSFKNEIKKITQKLKEDLKLNLFITNLDRNWKQDKIDLERNGISTDIFLIENGNYMAKINAAASCGSTFSIKLDEDIFLSAALWDYFIANIGVLNDDKNLFLSPILTTGIPSVDIFSEQFLSNDEKQQLYKIYLQTPLPSIWGANYSSLENFTLKANKWNCEKFYLEVSKINHHYKGVHPVRFSANAQEFILKFVLENFDKMINNSNFFLATEQRPYFCNSVFGIKTATWQRILNDKELFKDSFDEVPLNLYMQQNNLNMVFIYNGYGVHPSYNTINVFGSDYKNLSDKFFNYEYFKR